MLMHRDEIKRRHPSLLKYAKEYCQRREKTIYSIWNPDGLADIALRNSFIVGATSKYGRRDTAIARVANVTKEYVVSVLDYFESEKDHRRPHTRNL